MSLPKMDVPIGVVQWEVFVPEQYRARAIDGNMIDARRFNVRIANRHGRLDARRCCTGGSAADGAGDGHDSGGASPATTVRRARQRSAYRTRDGAVHVRGVRTARSSSAELPDSTSVDLRLRREPRRLEVGLEGGTVTESPASQSIGDVRSSTPRRPGRRRPLRTSSTCRARVGVLPIRVDVPRAGVSHEFIKPLVVGSRPR